MMLLPLFFRYSDEYHQSNTQDRLQDGSHGPWDLYASIHKLVYEPDTQNENENMLRSMLVSAPDTLGLISTLPSDMHWIKSHVHSSRLGLVNTVLKLLSHDAVNHELKPFNETRSYVARCGPVRQYIASPAMVPGGIHDNNLLRWCFLQTSCLFCRIAAELKQGIGIDTAVVVIGPSFDGPFTIGVCIDG